MKISLFSDGSPILLTAEKIEAAIKKNGLQEISRLGCCDQSFVVIVESDEKTDLWASKSFASQYFYRNKPPFVHGSRLANLVKHDRHQWDWDHAAVADYLVLDFVPDRRTIHANYSKILAGQHVVLGKKTHQVKCHSVLSNADEPDAENLNIETLDTLQSYVLRHWAADDILFITGGFDSRLLLACMLSVDIKPRMFVAGQEGCFDRYIAEKISKQFSLKLTSSVLPSDILDKNVAVATLASNGMLPLSHWPGSLIADLSPNTRIWLGFGGEAARSYYFDKGQYSIRLDKKSIDSLSMRSWSKKWLRIGKALGNNAVSESLAEHFSDDGARKSMIRNLGQSGTLGHALDRLFIDGYLRCKSAADLGIVRSFRSFAAPLLDYRWLNATFSLERDWKTGSRFHRWAINYFCPQLMGIPEEINGQIFDSTQLHAPQNYWRAKPSANYLHFVDQNIYLSKRIRDMAKSQSHVFDGLVGPNSLPTLWGNVQHRDIFFRLVNLSLFKSISQVT